MIVYAERQAMVKCKRCCWIGTEDELIAVDYESMDHGYFSHCPECEGEEFANEEQEN